MEPEGPTRGRFLVIEGADGVGKTTQVEMVGQAIGALGRQVIVTREPGGTALGEAIRGLLAAEGQIDPMAEAMLMSAARAQHCAHVIAPALAAGAWVVCDRFSGSFLAYQGYGRGMPRAQLDALVEMATAGLRPDAVVLLEAARPWRSLAEEDRFEGLGREFQERVRRGYSELAEKLGWLRIDALGSPEQVTVRIMESLASAGLAP